MRSLLLILIGLSLGGLAYADDNNLAVIYNNEKNLDMTVTYSTCYSYDNIWIYRKQYCTSTQTTLYGKNNPKGGASFVIVQWPRVAGSHCEYLTINKVTAYNFEATKSESFVFDDKFHGDNTYHTWQKDSTNRPSVIFAIKENELFYYSGVV